MTLNLDVSEGSIVMYGSNKIQNPNEAFYDFKLTNSQPEIFISDKTFSSPITKREITNVTDITIYISIQGQSVSNNFTLNTTTGDTTTDEPTTEPTTESTTTTNIYTSML